MMLERYRHDENLPFYANVEVTKDQILEALTYQIYCYVEGEIERGFEPSWEEFVRIYSEWNIEHLHPFIAGEVNRYAAFLLGSHEAI